MAAATGENGPVEIRPAASARGNPIEVFLVFLKLGLTAFGGPIAHLGFFQREIVHRREWILESAYGDLVALCQFLPGHSQQPGRYRTWLSARRNPRSVRSRHRVCVAFKLIRGLPFWSETSIKAGSWNRSVVPSFIG